MPIIKADDQIELYRARAALTDLSELSGRGGARFKTEFIGQQILDRVPIADDARVLDVGCGDGTFLLQAIAAGRGASFIGVLPTEEEAARVRDHMATALPPDGPPVEILTGRADAMDLPDASIDVLICNGVLLIACQTDEDAEAAAAEFARLVTPGGQVYVGEMPVRDADRQHDYGTTPLSYLRSVLRHEGGRAFARAAGRMLRGWMGLKPFIFVPSTRQYFCPPARFVALLERHGLRVVDQRPHRSITRSGEVVESDLRWNYLCERV